MKRGLLSFAFALLPLFASADEPKSVFADQSQYELFYEYTYRANLVERLIFECTADDHIWETFAYATAPLSNAYKEQVLGASVFKRDPFTDQLLVSLLWQELILNLKRSSEADGDPTEPRLMAQRDVLKLVNTYANDLDALCDFVFWEEVGVLERVLDDLLADAEARLNAPDYQKFLERVGDGVTIVRKLFAVNRLNNAP